MTGQRRKITPCGEVCVEHPWDGTKPRMGQNVGKLDFVHACSCCKITLNIHLLDGLLTRKPKNTLSTLAHLQKFHKRIINNSYNQGSLSAGKQIEPMAETRRTSRVVPHSVYRKQVRTQCCVFR